MKFRPLILSRHPSHNPLREQLPKLPFRSLVRLGSVTDRKDTVAHGGDRVELNSIEGIKNSASKLLMKQKFDEAKISTAEWCLASDFNDQFKFPIILKSFMGSRGMGNYLIKNQEELDTWKENHDPTKYIAEKYHKFLLEYRLHVSKVSGVFYTCRKALKAGIPEDQAWQRHDDNCVWFLEDGPNFYKPNSWNDIVDHCCRGLNSIGADILSFDVRVQREGNPQRFIVLESNSASSFGEITLEKYLQEIPKNLKAKYVGL